MLGEPQDILTTNSRVVQYQGGLNGELVIVYNPAANSNSVFLALNKAATTAGVTGQVQVMPGQFSIPFILNQEQNAGGINGIAATATTVVTVFRAPFLTPDQYNAAVIAFGVGLAAAQFWQFVSGSTTAIQPVGAIVEARADTIRTKTTGQALALRNDTGASVFNAATGANGNVDVVAPGSGQADLITSAGEDFVGVRTADTRVVRNNVTLGEIVDAQFSWRVSTAPLSLTDGGFTDERHRFNSTHYIRRMVGDDENNGVMECEVLPVVNAATVNPGDLVKWIAPNRCQVAALNDTSIVGVCVSGATGNAGGTTKAIIAMFGWLVNTLVADDAGVTAGQTLLGGATDVGQVASQATIEGTFALCTETAASGVVTSCRLFGPRG